MLSKYLRSFEACNCLSKVLVLKKYSQPSEVGKG